MNKETNKLIPEFRFPEFKNDKEWKKKQLSEILDYERPDNYIVKDINYIKTGTPVLTANKGFVLGYTNEDFGIYNNLPVIIFDDFTVDSKYVDFPFKVKSSAIKILKTKENDNLKFIYESITELKFNLVEHKRYYISEYQKLFVHVPEPTEQLKIADCLSSLDEVITAHTNKLKALKTYKKGFIQNLFPKDGESVPKLRFKEFEKYGEWEYLNGNKLFDTISNKKHDSDLPILAITQEQGAIPRNLINYNVVVTEKSIESYKVIEIGDFIISLRSFQGGIEYSNYKGICSPAYIILRKKNKYSENEFYKNYFKTDLYIRNLNKNLEGLRDGKMVSYSQFSEIKIPNPNPKEQQKIANTLSSLDDLIKEQVDKIEQLKLHKKGLMRGLFPKVKV
jgi:type I restriction enzyme S subunit